LTKVKLNTERLVHYSYLLSANYCSHHCSRLFHLYHLSSHHPTIIITALYNRSNIRVLPCIIQPLKGHVHPCTVSNAPANCSENWHATLVGKCVHAVCRALQFMLACNMFRSAIKINGSMLMLSYSFGYWRGHIYVFLQLP